MSCAALRVVGQAGNADALPLAGTVQPGLTPADLRSAYKIPESAGAGSTVAVVVPFDYPSAEADLDVYRKQFGLPPLAPGQFKKVNETGVEGAYPQPSDSWAYATALELDMVSAVAPRANILLVEADQATITDIGASVNTAVGLGANEVVNGATTSPGDESAQELTWADQFYNHPGVAVVAPAGDYGFDGAGHGSGGVTFPASAPHVVAVGGTDLVKAPGTARGWSETPWTGQGQPLPPQGQSPAADSGCSTIQPKPAFQKDSGCGNHRTVVDVSAVADPVAVYDSFSSVSDGVEGWGSDEGGDVSASIVAAMYAAAGPLNKDSEPNSLPYADTSDLNDVSAGSTATCDPQYLCTAGPGYDGPTGMGTPAGTGAFSAGPVGELTGTVTDASTGAPVAGAQVSLGSGTSYTDDKGTYFLNARPGDYTLSVTAFGYVALTVPATATEGASTRVDTALKAERTTTLSGKVNDASGHGYPLSAQVGIVGHPAAVSATDPSTGQYSIKVPAGGTYDVQVTAHDPGYLPQETAVAVGSGTTTHDFGLQADPLALNGLAAGYTQERTGDTQTFESGSVPDGWSVTGSTGSPQWAVTTNCVDPLSGVPEEVWGASGQCLKVTASTDADTLTDLTSPELPLPSGQDALLTFDSTGTSAYVSFSTDGGATWHTPWSTVGQFVSGHEAFALPVNGAPSVRVRFRFDVPQSPLNDLYSTALDNIRVGGASLGKKPGGLVVGTVTDVNTGKALDGVSLSTDGSSAPLTQTASIPGFGPQNDGYSFFASPGGTTVTAQLPPYETGTSHLQVTADRANSQDFALRAGRIEVSGTGDATVPSGTATDRTVTVRNTGTAPVKVAVSEHPGTADHGWSHVANLPESLVHPIAAVVGGTLYVGSGGSLSTFNDTTDFFAYNAGTGSWQRKASALVGAEGSVDGAVDGKIYVNGGLSFSQGRIVDETQIYDPATDSWSMGAANPDASVLAGGAVLDGKLYEVGGTTFQAAQTPTVSVYDPAENSWKRVHDYPVSVNQLACAGIAGKLYCAGGHDGTARLSDTFAYDPSTDTWTKVASSPVPLGNGAYSEANGELIVTGEGATAADSTPNSYAYNPACDCWTHLFTPGVAHYSGAGALGFVVGGGDDVSIGNQVELLPGFDQADANSVPWLSEDQSVMELQPGASAKVDVRMDAGSATISGPGPVNANLSFEADTPYAPPDLPVTMTVTSP